MHASRREPYRCGRPERGGRAGPLLALKGSPEKLKLTRASRLNALPPRYFSQPVLPDQRSELKSDSGRKRVARAARLPIAGVKIRETKQRVARNNMIRPQWGLGSAFLGAPPVGDGFIRGYSFGSAIPHFCWRFKSKASFWASVQL
jgi:hypothetical protein